MPHIPKYVRPVYRQIHHKLDNLCSKIVRAREPYCITCGTRDGLTCSHYIGRGKFSIRWDLRNCHTQCFICNQRHDVDKRPYYLAMIDIYGIQHVENVIAKLHNIPDVKVSTFDQHMILAELQAKAKEMGLKI